MSGDVETGSTRPRPLSGGFWTLLSWLRGEEHSSSSDSISSAGSDRTAVSFAFLAPAHYHGSAAPLVLPPPGPPTDSYKKRVHERNLRRHYDRDTTLHRKYGLYRGEGTVNLDVHSLPPARRSGTSNLSDKQDRDRRATSECYQRRTAHVPGKRRAPPPPTGTVNSINGISTLNYRRYTRKRPAPQPPKQTLEESKGSFKNKIIIPMNQETSQNNAQNSSFNITSMGCKPKKYIKDETKAKDVPKLRSEKSFLKQIFENRKRNSTSDTTSITILPNISELDKQAAEIIQSSKMKRSGQSNQENVDFSSRETVWYCIKCSKKYDKSINTCPSCKFKDRESFYSVITDPVKTSSTIYTQTGKELSDITANKKQKEMEDKQKLKEMLKEMKDSLPKRTKHNDLPNSMEQKKENQKPLEAPTLRIGSNIDMHLYQEPDLSKPFKISGIAPEKKVETKDLVNSNENIQGKKSSNVSTALNALHTPLKISSLLNPIYIPKPILIQEEVHPVASASSKETVNQNSTHTMPVDPIYVKAADAVRNILLDNSPSSNSKSSAPRIIEKNMMIKEPERKDSDADPDRVIDLNKNTKHDKDNGLAQLNIHARRRDLVNQLEKSIASGDERAAADAAIKLAQLRLSCSVLSFTSQILEQPSTSGNIPNTSAPLKKPIDTVKQSSIPVMEQSKATNIHQALKEPPASIVMPGTSNSALEKVNTNPKPLNQELSKVENSTKNVVKILRVEVEPRQNKSKHKSDVATQSVGVKIVTPAGNISQPSTSRTSQHTLGNNDVISVAVWVEDKDKAHGPIDIKIRRQAVVGELRRQAEQFLGIPARLQRWIIGRELCNDDATPLVSMAGPNLDAPFYLCLVECDKNLEEQLRNIRKSIQRVPKVNKNSQINEKDQSNNFYTELVKLESQAVVPNAEAFECEICMEHCNTGEGVVLRECVHSFCRQCLADVIRHCEEPTVSCPAMGCPGLLHEREIKALVNAEEYGRWLDRGLAAAESGTKNAFHCRTPDCTGWALCDGGVRRFPCPVCKHTNCVLCQAIHEAETCDQYQKKLKEAANTTTDQRDEGTQSLIDSLISRGEALQCPECNAVITKKWGCDWVKCSACKTEICWVTRGRRWGPDGRGDTSGGCRCGVDGKRCHPSCGYCH